MELFPHAKGHVVFKNIKKRIRMEQISLYSLILCVKHYQFQQAQTGNLYLYKLGEHFITVTCAA